MKFLYFAFIALIIASISVAYPVNEDWLDAFFEPDSIEKIDQIISENVNFNLTENDQFFTEENNSIESSNSFPTYLDQSSLEESKSSGSLENDLKRSFQVMEIDHHLPAVNLTNQELLDNLEEIYKLSFIDIKKASQGYYISWEDSTGYRRSVDFRYPWYETEDAVKLAAQRSAQEISKLFLPFVNVPPNDMITDKEAESKIIHDVKASQKRYSNIITWVEDIKLKNSTHQLSIPRLTKINAKNNLFYNSNEELSNHLLDLLKSIENQKIVFA